MTAGAEVARAVAMIEQFAVMVAQFVGMHPGVEVAFDKDADGWRCKQMSPEVWFGEPFFGVQPCPSRAHGPWTFDRPFVRLRTLDGDWVWRLTGETAEGPHPDGPMVTHRAVWPD